MAAVNLQGIKQEYILNGYVSGVDIISVETASSHRKKMENIESNFGDLHYKSKVHTILRSPYELSTLPVVLDIVEQFIGPDILLYDATYIVKEPHSKAAVSWHQDLTYWGLSGDNQVSMWLALSPANGQSGCMRMLPGSHIHGRRDHEVMLDENNVLLQGQTIRDVSEGNAVMCPLQPGQASFHHGWTLHASMPNRSNDRRIGLNVQYIAPHIRQTKHDLDSAMLVRGKDDYHHFADDIPAEIDLNPEAVARQVELEKLHNLTQGSS